MTKKKSELNLKSLEEALNSYLNQQCANALMHVHKKLQDMDIDLLNDYLSGYYPEVLCSMSLYGPSEITIEDSDPAVAAWLEKCLISYRNYIKEQLDSLGIKVLMFGRLEGNHHWDYVKWVQDHLMNSNQYHGYHFVNLDLDCESTNYILISKKKEQIINNLLTAHALVDSTEK